MRKGGTQIPGIMERGAIESPVWKKDRTHHPAARTENHTGRMFAL